MILTLDQLGQLAVSNSIESFPVKVDTLDDIHRVIEKYQIDFISPEVTEAHKHTQDKKLLNLLKEFHMQRAYVLMAAAMFKQLPEA